MQGYFLKYGKVLQVLQIFFIPKKVAKPRRTFYWTWPCLTFKRRVQRKSQYSAVFRKKPSFFLFLDLNLNLTKFDLFLMIWQDLENEVFGQKWFTIGELVTKGGSNNSINSELNKNFSAIEMAFFPFDNQRIYSKVQLFKNKNRFISFIS